MRFFSLQLSDFSLKETSILSIGINTGALLKAVKARGRFFIFNFKKDGPLLNNIVLVSQLGFTMAGSILFCFAIGYFLDKWLGTKGIFVAVFIILGVIGGGVTVYRQISEVIDLKSKKGSGSSK